MVAISSSSRERGLRIISSSSLIADLHLVMSSGLFCIPIQPANPCLASGLAAIFGTQAPENDWRVRLLKRLYAEATFRKRGEFAVILEKILHPDAVHDLDSLDDVFVP